MSVIRVPATPKPADEPMHWHIAAHAGRPSGLACGADLKGARFTYGSTSGVTCPDCLAVTVRRVCLEPDPDDRLGFGIVCKRDLRADGTHEGLHDWETPILGRSIDELGWAAMIRGDQQTPAARSMEALDTPSGRLPVRTPGAALRDEEGSDGPGGPGEAARPGANAFPREVVETWTA